MDSGLGPGGEASGPVALEGVPLGLEHQLHSKVFPPAGGTWVSSPTKDPSRSICFRLLKANSVTFPHLVPLTTHLCQTTNIDLPGGELSDVSVQMGKLWPKLTARLHLGWVGT